MSGKIKTSRLNDLTGWLGTQMLAWCAAPQAWQSVQQGHSEGVSWAFMALWGFGEIFAAIYVYNKHRDWPLLTNYILNLTFIGIIVYYMI